MTNKEAITKFESIKRGNIYLIHQKPLSEQLDTHDDTTDFTLCDKAIDAFKKLQAIEEIIAYRESDENMEAPSSKYIDMSDAYVKIKNIVTN